MILVMKPRNPKKQQKFPVYNKTNTRQMQTSNN